MRRTDHEHRVEPASRRAERVADGGGFGRREVLAKTPARRGSARAERVRPSELFGGGHEDHLPHAGVRHFLEHAKQRGGPVGQPMRLATPVTLGREGDEGRIGGPRQRE